MLTDERQQFTGSARAIVEPASTPELSAVVRHCARNGVAMVPQGGNTGYCGGATPGPDGSEVLIGLRRMNQIRDLDATGMTATVEAGVVLHDLQTAADDAGLLFPLSMGSETSCQIGGNLSTNAGGLAVLRYGTARDLVAGLEVVLADGSVWSNLTGLRKDATGYDLKQLFVGAEGSLGIISAAVVRLFPRPSTRATAWLSLPALAGAAPLLRFIQSQLGDCVSSFEYVSGTSLEYVLEHVPETRAPFPPAVPHQALVEISGFADSDSFEARFADALANASQRGLLDDAVMAQSGSEQSMFWRLRENIPAAERVLGGSIKHDVSVSISQIATLVEEAKSAVLARVPEVRWSVYGHVGDGNVHFNVLAPPGVAVAEFKRRYADVISDAVHTTAARMCGSFSAEHGVGQLKADLLAASKSQETLNLMRALKSALDPAGLMNPGKVLKSPQAE